MRLRAGFHTLLVLLALLIALPGYAQTGEAQPRGYVVAFGLSDELNVFHAEASRGAAILGRAYGRGTTPAVYTNTKNASRATVANLRASLAKAAGQMDRQNDV